MTVDDAVFTSHNRGPLTRFGIYKLVRRLTSVPTARRPPAPHIERRVRMSSDIRRRSISSKRGWMSM
jgi:hypothetical protein